MLSNCSAGTQAAAIQAIQWGLVVSKISPVTHCRNGTVDELFDRLCETTMGEKDGPGWIAGPIEPGPRKKERMSEAHVLVLDIEGKSENGKDGKRVIGPYPPDFREMVAGLERYGAKACIHTSYNNYAPAAGGDTVGPRYRVVFGLSRPITDLEIKTLGVHVASELGLFEVLDKGCLELSRLYYFPRNSESGIWLAASKIVNGSHLNVDEKLRRADELNRPLYPADVGKTKKHIIALWNGDHPIEEVLERNGYKRHGENRYLWPGSSTGMPGVVVYPDQGRIYSNHDQDPLNDGHSHDAFNVFKILECEGDFNRALEHAREDVGAEIASGEEPDPFDLDAARIGDLLDTDPPPRDWIIPDFLSRGVVGILIAPGGTGKSFLTLQLAVSVASGIPWLGMDIQKWGSVALFSAEDDRDELHRRLKRVVEDCRSRTDTMFDVAGWSEWDKRLRENFFAFDRVGCDNRLTRSVDRSTVLTSMSDQIIEVVHRLPEPPALIILDPLSRFDGGEPNSNADATRLIECAEKIRKATGASVLMVHHVAKSAMSNPDSGQEAARGASALSDSARMVLKLRVMTKEEVKKISGLKEEDKSNFLKFELVKTNYTKQWESMWLQRKPGGVLRENDLEVVARDRLEEHAEYARVLPLIIDHIKDEESKGKTVTRNTFRPLSGKEKRFGVSEKLLNEFINRAVKQGRIREQALKSRGKSLHIPHDRVSGELHDKTDNTAGNLDFIGSQPSVV